MNIIEQFRAAWILEVGHHGHYGPDLLPTVLARATARVLPVDAAGISFFGCRHRVPLGASAADAVTAERWQFTLGEGPCFAAYESGVPVIADETTLRQRWPALHDQLRRHSPFRSTVVLPLGYGARRSGAIDLYFTQPQPDAALDLTSAQRVATLTHLSLMGAWSTAQLDHELQLDPKLSPELSPESSPDLASGVSRWLTRWLDEITPAGAPNEQGDPVHPRTWLDSAAVRSRQQVWIAIGMCNAALHVDTSDAFALLRAHAYAQDKTLEEAACDVVTGRIPVKSLLHEAEDS